MAFLELLLSWPPTEAANHRVRVSARMKDFLMGGRFKTGRDSIGLSARNGHMRQPCDGRGENMSSS
jgi:hypothetical protein